MQKVLTIIICFLSLGVLGQTKIQSNYTKQVSLHWLEELADRGLTLTHDSVVISDEVQKVLQDSSYRDLLYPKDYTWTQTSQFLQVNQLKKAFWYMINLYPENKRNKEMAIRSILAYDKILKMDKILINTFYTYSYMDPEIAVIKSGNPEITRPDILEAKLRSVKEIVGYIHAYREQQEELEKLE